MLCSEVPLNTPKRSPQKPPVHFTALIGVEFIMAYLLLRVSVMPFCCAMTGAAAAAEIRIFIRIDFFIIYLRGINVF